jgi:hypothetical protein
MAAGLGSRYGGLKQVEPVGPAGESLLDYSVYDARRAGFGRVVFVIRRDMQTAFRAVIRPCETSLDVACAFQSLDDLPQGTQVPPGRAKPWGTGHALLAARDAVRTPFAAINADDFYGADSYRALAAFLDSPGAPAGPEEYALVSFRLSETLSEHGGVARAVCQASGDQLHAIEEVRALERTPNGVRGEGLQGPVSLRGDEPVSMNCWGFKPSVFGALGEAFAGFLARSGGEVTTEFLIPDFVNGLLREGRARLRVLRSASRWFGMTYREEHPLVVQRIRERVRAGEYPDPLWGG